MNINTDIAMAVLTEFQRRGYLKTREALSDAHLLPDLETIIGGHLRQEREDMAGFLTWWGEIGHRQHVTLHPPAFTRNDFWHCTHAMCLSLIGTISDLSQNKAPLPTDHPPIKEFTPLTVIGPGCENPPVS